MNHGSHAAPKRPPGSRDPAPLPAARALLTGELTMRRTTVALALAAAALVASAPVDANAQRYRARGGGSVGVAIYPQGLYLGAGLVGTRILSQDGGPELLDHGGGLTLYSGLRLNQHLALELGWLGSLHNPESVETTFGRDTDYLVLNGFTGDAKIFLESSTSAQPFLQGGVGVYFLDSSYFGTQSVGTGFQLGGGFDFAIGPNVDVGLRALYRGLAMGPPERAENDTFVSALTAEGTLTVHF